MADFEVVNNVGVITCQNPPVNQLSYNLRVGLLNGLQQAVDNNCVAAVIIGEGRTFIAGADIKEFSTGMAFKKSIHEVLEKIEQTPIPVIAAIHGTALGGGLELALTCHYRIGTSRSKVGVPEVLIGLLPGAGGTQRLPRVVGSMLAVEMCTSGMHMAAARAYKVGILDRIISVEKNHSLSVEHLILRNNAIQFALSVKDKPVENRIVSRWPVAKMDDFFWLNVQQMIAKRAKGMLSPMYNLEAVKAAQTCSTFAEGMKKERQLFTKLATSEQARCLQHLFFAQRMISKVPGVQANLAKKIKLVGVVGCGTMGGGILMNFVQVGIPVVVLEAKEEFIERGMNVVKNNWLRQVKKKKITKKMFEKYLSLVKTTVNYSDFKDCDIVIEAVFENLAVKEKVFKALDAVCKSDCILASNTSFIPIEKIARITSRPQNVVGCHFFAPANQMQLLENVRHAGSGQMAIASVQQMAKVIRKKGVLARSAQGFIGNRIFAFEIYESSRMLLEGATPKHVDDALRKFGWAMGIFQVNDLSGLDIGYRSRQDKGFFKEGFVAPSYYVQTSDVLVRDYGRLGLKVGKGWYDYPKGRKPVESKLVLKLIKEEANRRGLKQRMLSEIGSEEIIERLMYPMINEGCRILEEGVAIRPSDIDVVFVFGYGFPPYRGGIMRYGDSVGFSKIKKVLDEAYRKWPDCEYLKPCRLLEQVAESGISLDKFWRNKSRESKL